MRKATTYQTSSIGEKSAKASSERGYLFDSAVFSKICAGQIAPSDLLAVRLFATHVQMDEINNTPVEVVKIRLQKAFGEVDPVIIATSHSVWDVSAYDASKWSDDDDLLYEHLLARVRKLDVQRGNLKENQNQIRDALIGATAIREMLVLVTNDQSLSQAVTETGGRAIKARTLLKKLQVKRQSQNAGEVR